MSCSDHLGGSMPTAVLLLLLQSMFRSGKEPDKGTSKQEKDDTEKTEDLLEVGQAACGMGKSREE